MLRVVGPGAQVGPGVEVELADARPLQGHGFGMVDQVAKAGLASGEAAVVAGELRVEVGVEHVFGRFARLHVHLPDPQPRMHDQLGDVLGGALRVDPALGIQRRHVAAPDHDHPVAVFPGIDHVVEVTRREAEPADAVGRPEARDHAEAAVHLRMELDLVPAQGHGFVVVEQRQVVQHRVVFGHRHVVRQAGARQVDRHIVLECAVGPHHAVVHVGRVVAVVEEHEFFGDLVDLGVCGDLAAAVRDGGGLAQRFQRDRVDLVGVARHVPQRQRAAAVSHQVGVGGVLEAFVRAALERFADAVVGGLPGLRLLGPALGVHPAVAVGQVAVVEMRRMHHAIAIERVVPAIGRVTCVGAGPQVHAIEVGRDAALDQLQVLQLELLHDRGIDPCEQGTIVFAEGRQAVRGRAGVHGGVLSVASDAL